MSAAKPPNESGLGRPARHGQAVHTPTRGKELVASVSLAQTSAAKADPNAETKMKAPGLLAVKPASAARTATHAATGSQKATKTVDSPASQKLKPATSGNIPQKPSGLVTPLPTILKASRIPVQPKTPLPKSIVGFSLQASSAATMSVTVSSSSIQAQLQPQPSAIPGQAASQPACQFASSSASQLTDDSATQIKNQSPVPTGHFANRFSDQPATQFGGQSTSHQPSLDLSMDSRVSDVWKQRLTDEINAAIARLEEDERVKQSLVASRDAALQDLEMANKQKEVLSLENKKLRSESEQQKAIIQQLEVRASPATDRVRKAEESFHNEVQTSSATEKARKAEERLRNVIVKKTPLKDRLLADDLKRKQEAALSLQKDG